LSSFLTVVKHKTEAVFLWTTCESVDRLNESLPMCYQPDSIQYISVQITTNLQFQDGPCPWRYSMESPSSCTRLEARQPIQLGRRREQSQQAGLCSVMKI